MSFAELIELWLNQRLGFDLPSHQLSVVMYCIFLTLGFVFGSFFSLLIHRLPHTLAMNFWQTLKTISLGGSKCPHCQHNLKTMDLIPVLSWLYQRGQCRYCQQNISWTYPVHELATGILFIAVAWFFQQAPWSHTLAMLGFTSTLWIIAWIDWQHQLILDKLSLPLLWAGLVFHLLFDPSQIPQSLWGVVFGYGSLWLIYQVFLSLRGVEGMGHGDFKLSAAIGAWLGIEAMPSLLFLAAIFSIALFLLLVIVHKKSSVLKQALPFAPAMVMAAYVILFLQP